MESQLEGGLVLQRKLNESLMIGDEIEVTVIRIAGDRIRLHIKAPDDVKVWRKEIWLQIKEAEQC